MTEDHINNGLWLGTGGGHPGVRLVPAEDSSDADGAALEVDGSVYTMDVDPRINVVAWATRSGAIYLLPGSVTPSDHEDAKPARFLAGTAVTSLGFTSSHGLISADEAGRVLLWPGDVHNPSPPTRVDTRGCPVCMLGATPSHIVGLGRDGQILVWRDGAELEALLAGPAPARPVAFARLVTWTVEEHSFVVYPAARGALAVIRTDPPSVCTVPAHEGRWYASFPVDDALATIGHDDGCLRLWKWTGEEPVFHNARTAIFGVVDAETFPADPSCGVAVLSSGRAVRFALDKKSLAVVGSVPGDCYRVVAGPSARFQHAMEVRRRQERADELEQRIVASLEQNPETNLSETFRELESLGFHASSLALRAYQAHGQGDRLAELDSRHRLMKLLPPGSPETLPHLERYLALLLHVGQYELALEVSNAMERIEAGSGIDPAPRWLASVVAAIRAGENVVFTETDPVGRTEERITAATIVGRPLVGLWELHRSGPLLLPDAALHPADLSHAIRAISNTASAPTIDAAAVPVLWSEDGTAEPIEVVLLASPGAVTWSAFKVLLRLSPSETGTELIRSILLDPGRDAASAEVGRSESDLLRTVEVVRKQGGRAAFLAPINQVIHQTLRSLRGSALAQRPSEEEAAA